MSEPPAIDPDGAELVYVQVANHMAARIERGEWEPNRRLPPERELAEEYGVSYDSVRRATAVLRERGLIRTVHGRGTFVEPHSLADSLLCGDILPTMRIVRDDIGEDEMVLAFLSAEVDSPRFGVGARSALSDLELVRDPDLSDTHANQRRSSALAKYRGWGTNDLLFKNFPREVISRLSQFRGWRSMASERAWPGAGEWASGAGATRPIARLATGPSVSRTSGVRLRGAGSG